MHLFTFDKLGGIPKNQFFIILVLYVFHFLMKFVICTKLLLNFSALCSAYRVHWSSAGATTHTCSTKYCGYFRLQWRALGCALAPARSTTVGCGPSLAPTFMFHRFFLFSEMFSLTLQGSWIAAISFLKSYALILPSSRPKRFSQSWHHVASHCPFSCDGSGK